MIEIQQISPSLFLLGALITVIAGIQLLIHYQTRLAVWGGIFTLAMALDLACYALLVTSKPPATLQFWFRGLILSFSLMLACWLFFVYTLTGRELRADRRMIILGGALPLFAGIILLVVPAMDPVWMNTLGAITGWGWGFGLPGNLFTIYVFALGLISMDLSNFLAQSYRGRSGNVAIQINADNIMLDIETAIPCGLIVNELVSNSMKYAFPDNREGQITLSCHETDDRCYTLSVSDNGVGLPAEFDINQCTSLGLKLVASLVGQLGGNLDIFRDRSTTFQVSLKG